MELKTTHSRPSSIGNYFKNYFEELFYNTGASTINVLNTMGEMFMMLQEAMIYAVKPPYKLKNIFKQMEFVGVGSLFVVILTGSFTGMVLALQSFDALKRFGAESLVGPTVALSMARELGPVLTGLMVTGRAGSAMATELGTMRVTEQIDALYTMAVNPTKHLVTPRIIAGMTMLPLLTVVTMYVGIVGGYMIGVKMLGINSGVFIGRVTDYVDTDDIFYGVTKAFFFGIIITLVACYHGYNTRGGAAGVGKAATRSVVMASVLILVSDYILTSIMF